MHRVLNTNFGGPEESILYAWLFKLFKENYRGHSHIPI